MAVQLRPPDGKPNKNSSHVEGNARNHKQPTLKKQADERDIHQQEQKGESKKELELANMRRK